jgi:hypothetical protein
MKVVCAACGSSAFKTPKDPNQSSVVTCGGCGCVLGTVAEIEAAGKSARPSLGKNPTPDQLREALKKAFGNLKTVRVE